MLAKTLRLVNRLKVMGWSETASRVVEQLRLVRLYFAYRSYDLEADVQSTAPDQFEFCRQNAQLFVSEDYFRLSETAFNELQASEGKYLGGPWQWSERDDTWRHAPDTQRCWGRGFFAFINYRPDNRVGDVRVAWEPSRLQYLLHRALRAEASATAESKSMAAKSIAKELHSWVSLNPHLDGIHYISVMECGLRIIAVSHTLDLLREEVDERTWREYLVMVRGHADLIAQRLSLHSSTGNHTLAEAVGLLYAALLLPELPQSDEWRVKAVAIINDEVPAQILPDGTAYEGATWYLLLVADLIALAIELAHKNQLRFDAAVYERLTLARKFIHTMGSGAGDLLRIGDSDDGFALSPLLKLNWQAAEEDQTALLNRFDDGGITSITLKPDGTNTAQLCFLHNHAGMPPLHAHSHADCLSVLLDVNGTRVLVDPGTYTYNGDQKWRRYFRSTRAHNTLVIDGDDQFEQLSNFQWQNPYRCNTGATQEHGALTVLSACHDGYKNKGVVHRRTVLVDGARVLIWDLVTGASEHNIEMNWHFAGVLEQHHDEEVVMDVNGYKVYASWPGQKVNIATSETDPQVGWYSSSYGEKLATHTVYLEASSALPWEAITAIGLGGSARGFSADERITRVLDELREKYR